MPCLVTAFAFRASATWQFFQEAFLWKEQGPCGPELRGLGHSSTMQPSGRFSSLTAGQWHYEPHLCHLSPPVYDPQYQYSLSLESNLPRVIHVPLLLLNP